jgi:threonine synthase
VLVNSLNPYRIEGQKTAAFEILEDLGRAPDVLALPFGGGGNIRAYSRGFAEADAGTPRLVAGEAEQRRTTLASAIRIVEPAHAAEAAEALRGSRGMAVPLPDEAILEAWRDLARTEGVLCEPSSAAGLAALVAAGVEPGTRVVCVLTGHGLKDSEAAARESAPPIVVDADPDAIAEAAS